MGNVIGVRTEPLPTRTGVAPALAGAGDVSGGAEGLAQPESGPAVDVVVRREVVAQKEARLLEIQRLLEAKRQESQPDSQGSVAVGAHGADAKPASENVGLHFELGAFGAGHLLRESDLSLEERAEPPQARPEGIHGGQDQREQEIAAAEQRLRAENEALDARISAEASRMLDQRRATLEADFARREADLRKDWHEASLVIQADAKIALEELRPRHAANLQNLERQYQELAGTHAVQIRDLSAEVTRLQGILVQFQETNQVAQAEEQRAGESARQAESRRQAELGNPQGELDRSVARRDALRKDLEALRAKLSETRTTAGKLLDEKLGLEGQAFRKQLGNVGSKPGMGTVPGPVGVPPGVGPVGWQPDAVDSTGWNTWSSAPAVPPDDGTGNTWPAPEVVT